MAERVSGHAGVAVIDKLDSAQVLLALVRSGHAVTLLPDLVGAQADPTLAVRNVAEGALTRLVFTAVRAASADSPALRAVREALRETAQRVAVRQ